MKFWIIMVLQVAVLAAFAAGPPLQNFCDSFTCDGCEITWSVTNQLPVTTEVLKVVPTKFSVAAVSNLLQLAELTEKDKKRPIQVGVFTGKGVRSYGNRKETRSLELVPSEGFIVMVNSDVVAGLNERPEGIPTIKEALELALSLLPRLDLPESELARNRTGKISPLSVGEETDIFKEKPSGTVVTNLLTRTIFLGRMIDGIPVWAGDIRFRFGSRGRVAELEIVRRTVETFKQVSVPSRDEFLRLIKNGKTLIRNNERRTFKKLTITNTRLYYWENFGSEPQKFIYPFAVLEAYSGETGKDSKLEIFVPFANE